MRRNRGIVYDPKRCEICGDEYVPTSGRQKACMKPECRLGISAKRLERRAAKYAADNPRISEKECEWDNCTTVFPVAYTGMIPIHCDVHRKINVAPRAQAATAAWRKRTIDVECRYWNCKNLQHPSAQGWCHLHYPILSMHGLNADAWWEYFNAQNGKCPICSIDLQDGRIIAVDHDHVTAPTPRHDKEHVRGLLHAAPCNSIVVGGIETAIANDWLNNALAYIKYPPSESN